jgi:hypothetical protein
MANVNIDDSQSDGSDAEAHYMQQYEDDENQADTWFNTGEASFACRNCNASFESRNKLYKHLQNCFIHRRYNRIFRRKDIFDQHLAECGKAVSILREGVQGMERPKPNIPQISADEIVESKATPCED